MRKRSKRKQLAGTESQHEEELTRSRNALRSFMKTAETQLDRGDCAAADRWRKQALIAFGAAAAHFDASMPWNARGTFKDATLTDLDKRFVTACLLKKAR